MLMHAFLHPHRLALKAAHARQVNLSEFSARMVFHVGTAGATVAQLSAELDVDKAQVSRAALQLVEDGLLRRGALRGALEITAAGQAVLDVILRTLRAQEAMYLRHLSKREAAILLKVVDQLAANAESLLPPDQARWLEVQRLARLRKVKAQDPSGGQMTVTRVLTVTRLVSRIMNPRLKAISGRPPLEALVFSQIADAAPLTLPALIEAMQRDKAQIGRIVKSLAADGLVARARIPGSRDTSLSPTAAGRRLRDLLTEDRFALDAALLSGVPADDYAVFVDVLGRMAADAQQLLAYEEALAAGPALQGRADHAVAP
jgi:DNA-binding MarR family transcriptional regulator